MNTRSWRRSARLMGLGQTTADLAAVQRRWKALLGATGLSGAGFGPAAAGEPTAKARTRPGPSAEGKWPFGKSPSGKSPSGKSSSGKPSAGPSPLREVSAFGPNPGGLRMFAAVPAGLPRGAPLVVVLHGCTQDAAGYDRGSGWSSLAAEGGFAVLYPEQQKRNNAHGCFSWFQQPDVTRDHGEVASIRDMVLHMVESHGLDRHRIFVTGLSAGAAMANAMLASYPELFAAGALIGGLPYGAAAGLGEAFQAMTSGKTSEPERWAEHVRAAAPAPAWWPRVAVWHGTADTTVSPVNATETVKQWLGVHGLAGQAPVSRTDGPLRRRTWQDRNGHAMVEEVLIQGMGHGTPVDRAVPGEEGRFFLQVGVPSTRLIAAGWGLVRD